MPLRVAIGVGLEQRRGISLDVYKRQDEIKDCCQGVIRFNCLSGYLAVQGQILMRDSLCCLLYTSQVKDRYDYVLIDTEPAKDESFAFSRFTGALYFNPRL